MKLSVVGGSYAGTSSNFQGRYACNIMPMVHPQQEGAKYPATLRTCAGKKQIYDFGATNPIRGMCKFNGVVYLIAGTTLYSKTGIGYTNLGTVTNTYYKHLQMVPGGDQILICGGTQSDVYNIATNELTRITDVDFVGADRAAFIDGYFINIFNDLITFSQPDDALSYDGLDILELSYRQSGVLTVHVAGEMIFFFGSDVCETFINDGTNPFSRQIGSSSQVGIVGKDAGALVGDSVYFVGNGREEGLSYYVRNGASLDNIGVGAPAEELATFGDISDCFVLTYEEYGKTIVHFTFPSVNVTKCYNVQDKIFFDKKSVSRFNNANGTERIIHDRASCAAMLNQVVYMGDSESGKLFILDAKTHTDAGLPLRWYVQTSSFSDDQSVLGVTSLIMDYNAGEVPSTITPNIVLRISHDGGHTWNKPKYIPLGVTGNFTNKIMVHGLGASRDSALEVSGYQAFRFIISEIVIHGVGSKKE